MNILIKLTCLVGLVIAPILGEIYGGGHASIEKQQDKKEIKVDENGVALLEEVEASND